VATIGRGYNTIIGQNADFSVVFRAAVGLARRMPASAVNLAVFLGCIGELGLFRGHFPLHFLARPGWPTNEANICALHIVVKP
jgi:hypothetical protein